MKRDIQSSDQFAERLLKAMPAEITGAYLAIRTITSPESNTNDGMLFYFAVSILILSPLFLYFVLEIRKISLILFQIFSFVIWAINIDIVKIMEAKAHIQNFLRDELYFILDPFFIKGSLIIWVLLIMPIFMAVFRERAINGGEAA